jgi:hypothetical protein
VQEDSKTADSRISREAAVIVEGVGVEQLQPRLSSCEGGNRCMNGFMHVGRLNLRHLLSQVSTAGSMCDLRCVVGRPPRTAQHLSHYNRATPQEKRAYRMQCKHGQRQDTTSPFGTQLLSSMSVVWGSERSSELQMSPPGVLDNTLSSHHGPKSLLSRWRPLYACLRVS